MRRRLVTAEHVHGPTGLDGPNLPAPTMPVQSRHGVQYLIETFRQAESGAITLVTLGPLTNVAMALVQAPDIAPRIREIVAVLGTWSENGNITPAAAFNEYVDPEAADVVLTSGIPLTMVPMDVTHQCLTTPPRLSALRANDNACSVAAADMLAFSEAFDITKYGWRGRPARPLRGRLFDQSGHVRRTKGQCDGRDDRNLYVRHVRRGLVARDGSRAKCVISARRRRRRILRAAHRAA